MFDVFLENPPRPDVLTTQERRALAALGKLATFPHRTTHTWELLSELVDFGLLPSEIKETLAVAEGFGLLRVDEAGVVTDTEYGRRVYWNWAGRLDELLPRDIHVRQWRRTRTGQLVAIVYNGRELNGRLSEILLCRRFMAQCYEDLRAQTDRHVNVATFLPLGGPFVAMRFELGEKIATKLA